MLDNKDLQFTFFNDKREGEDQILNFYERNTAGRGLDFDDYPENKFDFVMYAAELRCLNPVVDTKKTPLPPLEDLAVQSAFYSTSDFSRTRSQGRS